MKRTVSRGHAEVVIIVVAVVAILGGLGWALWSHFHSDTSPADSKPKATKVVDYMITRGPGDMDTYTNTKLGFAFQFPHQAYAPVSCKKLDSLTLSDDRKVPLTNYDYTNGAADMTVVSGENTFTITAKNTVVITNASYGTNGDLYFSACNIEPATQKLLDDLAAQSSDDIGRLNPGPQRSFQVYKLSSESDIDTIWKKIDAIAWKKNITGAKHTLKDDKEVAGRKIVDYDFTYSNNELVGGGAIDIWYYPTQKLFVTFDRGQAVAFTSPDESTTYDQDIVNSFYVR